jgi:CxxC motif-containing protein (DUF1111 family)
LEEEEEEDVGCALAVEEAARVAVDTVSIPWALAEMVAVDSVVWERSAVPLDDATADGALVEVEGDATETEDASSSAFSPSSTELPTSPHLPLHVALTLFPSVMVKKLSYVPVTTDSVRDPFFAARTACQSRSQR